LKTLFSFQSLIYICFNRHKRGIS